MSSPPVKHFQWFLAVHRIKSKLLHCDRRSSMDRPKLKGGDLYAVLSSTVSMQENELSVAGSSDFLRKTTHSDFYAKSPTF